jgi:hypothetical protein
MAAPAWITADMASSDGGTVHGRRSGPTSLRRRPRPVVTDGFWDCTRRTESRALLHCDPVAKLAILPAGQTLGVTEQPPLLERHM